MVAQFGANRLNRVEDFHGYISQSEPMFRGILSLAPSLLGLKIFVIRGSYLNQVISEISRELVWLSWLQIGQRNLPSQFSLKNLRVLELYELYEHQLEELWEADNDVLVQLRELAISDCRKFQRFPNSIGCLKELKKIVIKGGDNILSLPEEFCRLQSLEHFQLENSSLKSLPNSFGDLSNLRYLEFRGCRHLRRLPISFKNRMLLEYVNLESCKEVKLASEDFQNITKLEFLSLSFCKQVKELPRHITDQTSLRELHLDGMKGLRELPINIGQLSRLRKMAIANKLFTSLPTTLGDLSLTDLSIQNCHRLECMPPSLGDLSSLTDLTIECCHKLECLPPSLRDLLSLTNLTIVVDSISNHKFRLRPKLVQKRFSNGDRTCCKCRVLVFGGHVNFLAKSLKEKCSHELQRVQGTHKLDLLRRLQKLSSKCNWQA